MHEYKLYPRFLGGETSDSDSSDLTLSFFLLLRFFAAALRSAFSSSVSGGL
jgi:hypothetical protein